ncbi:hypothetical protein Tco_0909874 [Tanacetum coccineum]|uniref:Uncharacterized protein n=1 Tax=Tanacetum coccineum TaxID=301880 RepID=A0ABQ5CS90_9ASTR
MTTPSPSPPIFTITPSAGERLARCLAPPAHLALIDAVTTAITITPLITTTTSALYISTTCVTIRGLKESSTVDLLEARDRYGFCPVTVDAEEMRQGLEMLVRIVGLVYNNSRIWIAAGRFTYGGWMTLQELYEWLEEAGHMLSREAWSHSIGLDVRVNS